MTSTDELRALLAEATGDKPLPWTVWTSCSFRRVGCDATGADGDVLSAYNQRSDSHPDLSMPEERLKAWVALTNALPDLLNALDRKEGEIARLREALARYGKHDGLCALVGGYGFCSCGLEAARKALSEREG